MNRVFIRFMQTSLLLMTSAGCGSGESFEVAPVRGKVVCDGKPVAEGVVQFSPVSSADSAKPGKTGVASIEPDGTFVLSTYEQADGAVIGPCDVIAGSSDPVKPWPHALSKPVRYEVQSSGNDVVIEILSDGTGKVSPTGS